MEAKAIAKYMRVSPQKAGIVMNMIRGKDVNDALAILKFTPNKSAKIVEKVLKSAIANAENNYGLDKENLYVKDAVANQGPIIKRMMPRAQGRSNLMRRRTSHIVVVVNEK